MIGGKESHYLVWYVNIANQVFLIFVRIQLLHRAHIHGNYFIFLFEITSIYGVHGNCCRHYIYSSEQGRPFPVLWNFCSTARRKTINRQVNLFLKNHTAIHVTLKINIGWRGTCLGVECVSCSVVSDSVTLWTVASKAPLSMGFSRPEYWSE